MAHRKSIRFSAVPIVVGLGLGVLGSQVGACSLAIATGAGGDYATTTTSSVGTGGDASVDATPDGTNPPHASNYAQLCGQGECVPGVDVACTPTKGTSAATTSASSTASSSTSGAGGAASSGSAGDATSSGSGATTGSSSSSGTGGAGPSYGCQISGDGSTPTSVCGLLGKSALDGPCQSASDCAGGLGCVLAPDQPDNVGLCKPYCCGDWEDCPAKTYCAPRPELERPDRMVPVCTGINPCQLLTPGACSDPTEMCTVVRADGSTSCVPQGNGMLCGECPCAPGFVCSGDGFCQKLCHTAATDECGSGSLCQGGSVGYPDGIGLCVGGASDCKNAQSQKH